MEILHHTDHGGPEPVIYQVKGSPEGFFPAQTFNSGFVQEYGDGLWVPVEASRLAQGRP